MTQIAHEIPLFIQPDISDENTQEALASEKWYRETELYSGKDSHGILPIGRSTFKAMVKAGELPRPIKAGGVLMYTEGMVRMAKRVLLHDERPGRGSKLHATGPSVPHTPIEYKPVESTPLKDVENYLTVEQAELLLARLVKMEDRFANLTDQLNESVASYARALLRATE
ncbi:helix-turn-helix transcriptional regulator [Parahaliea mediterranea]|uniref:helix-turn-helix transcriptional regulator n=1 Tax=Parahaliea mediterranea TaxID=651086 RepID=UPI000E2F37AB|nr:hypothetical protein [Parahaliea mediterranea]